MTDADIAAMQADMMAGTPGDWTSGVYRQRGADLGYVYAAGKSGSVCMDATDVDSRRIARVPLYEATIIALTEANAAQAAEIERLTEINRKLCADFNLMNQHGAKQDENILRLKSALLRYG